MIDFSEDTKAIIRFIHAFEYESEYAVTFVNTYLREIYIKGIVYGRQAEREKISEALYPREYRK